MTGPSPQDRSETLETLVFNTLERMEIEGPAAIESAVSSHPELEQQLRRRLGALQSMGLIAVEDEVSLSVPSSLGNYEIGARIGEGGMGLVFQARDTVLGRDVALKLIRPEFVASPSLRERFTRESLGIARLQHPSVGRIFDAGEIAGFPYMAMEYIEGCTLSQVLDALDGRSPGTLTGRDFQACIQAQVEAQHSGKRPRSVTDSDGLFAGTWAETCIRIGLAVAEGLSCAHAAGVLHRDIKASNVMVTTGGRVILIDFGLAQLDNSVTLTKTGGRIGSLPYIAPERIVRASPASEAADLYGLGVLLYELFTLRLPFRAKSEAALVKLIVHGEPLPLQSINPNVPPLFREVTARAMRRDPLRRPPSAADYAIDLSRVLASQPPLPHGDGPVAALRSRWRAQPIVTGALVASTLLLLALPAVVLSVKARAAERSALTDRQSTLRLRLALEAADDLQRSTPLTEVVDGTSVGHLRNEVLNALVELRGTILADPRFEPVSESLLVEANLSQAEALVRLGRHGEARAYLQELNPSIDSVRNQALVDRHTLLRTKFENVAPMRSGEVVAALERLLERGAHESSDRATILAAQLALDASGPGVDSSWEALARDSVESLRNMRKATSHAVDAKAHLAQLLHRLAILSAGRDETREASAYLAEALALLDDLRAALPESERLVAQQSEWSAFRDFIQESGQIPSESAATGKVR